MFTRRSILSLSASAGFTLLHGKDLTFLPSVRVTTAQNIQLQLNEWKDSTVIVNFWATWCGPCRQELKELQKIADEHRQHVRILGIALDQMGWKEVTPFLRQHDIQFPVALINRTILRAFGFRREPEPVPQTFIFEPGGKLAIHFKTALAANDFTSLIEKIDSKQHD